MISTLASSVDSSIISKRDRHNSITTRNARLAAIHSLFRYAALRYPEHALLIQRVLAIPHKRSDSADVCFLTRDEIDALLAVPNQSTRLGRRDHLLLLVAIQTGSARLRTHLVDLRRRSLGAGAHLRCTGKNRKQRCTPLTRPTARLLQRGSLTDAAHPRRSSVPQPHRWIASAATPSPS